MAQQVRLLPADTVTFTKGKKVPLNLDRGVVYRELYLRLQGQPTIAGGANTQAATLQGDEWAVVSEIDIKANNTQVIRSFPGNVLWWLNYFLYGINPDLTSILGDGATANPSFDSTLIMPFWMPGTVRPMDTALDARFLSSLKLNVTWGDYDSINAAASAWTSEPTLEIWGLASYNVEGKFNATSIYEIEKTVSASASKFDVELTVDHMYRGFLINTTNDGKDANNILNAVKVRSGSTIFADVAAKPLSQFGRYRHGAPRIHNTGAAVKHLELRRGTTYNNVEGWYFIDFVTDGYMSECPDTLGFSQFKLELNVTKGAGITKVFVYPIEIIPVRGQA